jgi:hypothetical protein
MVNKDSSMTIANFGYIPYGKKIHGKAELSDPLDGCGPIKT